VPKKDKVNELFEKLIEACKEHGFSESQISSGMKYMDSYAGNHYFRDGLSHASIKLRLKPLKATLVKQIDGDGHLYWNDEMLSEYRIQNTE
jgi:hypothetical protein